MNEDIDSMGVFGGSVDDNPHRNTLESFRLDNSDVLRDFELELRSYDYDPINRIWKKPKEGTKNKFGMSNACVKQIISDLRTVLHKSNAQGNLSTKYGGEQEYQDKVDAYAQAFDEVMIYNMEDYGININAVNSIATNFQETVRTFFTRILGDGERTREQPRESFIHKDDMNADDNKLGLN